MPDSSWSVGREISSKIYRLCLVNRPETSAGRICARMLVMKSVLFVNVGFISIGEFVQPQHVTPAMKADFLKRLKTAIVQKDFNAFVGLYSQKGTVDPAMKDKLDQFTKGLFDTISGMASPNYLYSTPRPDMMTSFSRNGKNYAPNLPIVLLLQVQDQSAQPNTVAGGVWRLPLGVEKGMLMIVQTVLKD